MNRTKCECEHNSHFHSTLATHKAHPYGHMCEGDMVRLTTPYGTYTMCMACTIARHMELELLDKLEKENA